MEIINEIEALAWLDAYNKIHNTDYCLYELPKRCYKLDNLIIVMYVDGNKVDGIFIYGKMNKYIIPDIIKICANQDDIKSWTWNSAFPSSKRYDTAIDICNGTKFFGDTNWIYSITREQLNSSNYLEKLKKYERTKRSD